MKLTFGQHQQQKMIQTLAPRMIQSMEILQMPLAQLEERIEQELIDNPVLEQQEKDPALPDAPISDTPTDAEELDAKELVVDEAHQNAEDFQRLDTLDAELPEVFDEGGRPSSNRVQEQIDWQHDLFANVPERHETLQAHLIQQLGEMDIEPALLKMCQRIISSLSSEDGGYLKVSLEDLLPAGADEQQLQLAGQALAIIHQLDPPGVGARDLKECLLLQLTPDMPFLDEMKQLITHHLEDLRDNRLPQIQKATGYSIQRIQDAWNQLRKLNPKPASRFAEQHAPPVQADLSVVLDDAGQYVVKMDEGPARSLYISKYYRQRLANGEATPDEREFIKRKLNSAQWLIDAIEQRRNTLIKVSQAIIEHQRSFLDNGPEYIEPLKMQQIAEKVGVHVTTVSRAVDDKWIDTPRGIFALRRFFVGGTQTEDGEDVAWDAIRIKLQEMIDHEDKARPLSDDEIVKRLHAQGLKVARRTVTKYRQKMGIPSSRQRRDWSKVVK